MPIYILQALNTETCLNCLWWQVWWFVTKKLRATWTLSWNIQTKALGNFENDIYFNHLATIHTGLIWFQVTTKETCTLKWLHPSFLKSQMQLLFMAVHSRYVEIYEQKPLVILKKTHLFQSFSNNLSRTHLISNNNKRDMHSKMTPPFFF